VLLHRERRQALHLQEVRAFGAHVAALGGLTLDMTIDHKVGFYEACDELFRPPSEFSRGGILWDHTFGDNPENDDGTGCGCGWTPTPDGPPTYRQWLRHVRDSWAAKRQESPAYREHEVKVWKAERKAQVRASRLKALRSLVPKRARKP